MTQLSYNLVKESSAIRCPWKGRFLLSAKACFLLRVHHHNGFSYKLRPWNRKKWIVDLTFFEHLCYLIMILALFIQLHQVYWWNNHTIHKDSSFFKPNFKVTWKKLKCVATLIQNRQVRAAERFCRCSGEAQNRGERKRSVAWIAKRNPSKSSQEQYQLYSV